MVDSKKIDNGADGSGNDADNDFVLKHRVAGAAFLLFFGALVLPWMLGPPSEASKTPTALTVDTDNGEISALEIENELLVDLEDNSDIETEQVYISKITPLDAARVEEQKRRAEAEKASKSSAAVMARADVGGTAQDEATKEVNAEKPKKDKPAEKQQAKASDSDTKSKPEVKKAEAQSKKPVIASAKPETKPQAKPKPDTRQNALDAALAAESGNVDVDVGWVVQVGVFTDKNGAEKVVKDLKTKGFKPSTSIVDTNRGKATGTRVWLGPFAQRVDAAKTKTRLTDRTGEPGFIRAYP